MRWQMCAYLMASFNAFYICLRPNKSMEPVLLSQSQIETSAEWFTIVRLFLLFTLSDISSYLQISKTYCIAISYVPQEYLLIDIYQGGDTLTFKFSIQSSKWYLSICKVHLFNHMESYLAIACMHTIFRIQDLVLKITFYHFAVCDVKLMTSKFLTFLRFPLIPNQTNAATSCTRCSCETKYQHRSGGEKNE